MKVFTQNNMIFWETVENAAQYVVWLYIGAEIYSARIFSRICNEKPTFLREKHDTDQCGNIAYQKIDEFVVNKVKTYHTFTDLVDITKEYRNGTRYDTHLDYFISVSAEDKLGNTIEQSKRILMKI